MPYTVQKSGKGYKVITKATGKAHSKKPLSKAKALAQMRAIQMSKHEKREKGE